MTPTELYEFLYDWIDSVLNVTPGTVPIIQAFQNVADPAYPYIAIDAVIPGIGMQTIGYPQRVVNQDTFLKREADDEAYQSTLYEVGGDGSLLKAILNSTRTQAVQSRFDAATVVFYNAEPITNLTQDEGSTTKSYTKEYAVTLNLGGVEVVDDAAVTQIETVELNNNIGNP